MIDPKQSQVNGLIFSTAIGMLSGLLIWTLLAWVLNFWYFDKVVAPMVGFALGALSAYGLYTTGLRDVPLNWVGIGRFLGKPDGTFYQTGNQWVSPLGSIYNCPGEDLKFVLIMGGEKINAQDGIVIFFGVDDPLHPGKHNRLQWSVVDPMRYIAVDNPEDLMREEFLEKARLFFGQFAKALGVKNAKLLFDKYLLLPKGSNLVVNHPFRTELEAAQYVTIDSHGNNPAVTERLFSDASVTTLMGHAGEFLEKVEAWGIGKIDIFTPNVRENPEAEIAAARKAAAVEDMVTLGTKVSKINSLAKEMVGTGVSPDLAATMVAKISGEDVRIEHKTQTISGLPEVLRELGTLAINKLSGNS